MRKKLPNLCIFKRLFDNFRLELLALKKKQLWIHLPHLAAKPRIRVIRWSRNCVNNFPGIPQSLYKFFYCLGHCVEAIIILLLPSNVSYTMARGMHVYPHKGKGERGLKHELTKGVYGVGRFPEWL